MCLQWSEQHGSYLYSSHHLNGSSVNTSAWLYELQSLLNRDLSGICTTTYNNHVIQFDISWSQLSEFFKMHVDTVKTTGVICLIGIGLGFGFTSWIIYKVYLKPKVKSNQRKRRPSSLSEDVTQEGLNALVMGNGHSISADLTVADIERNEPSPGVRLRPHVIVNNNKSSKNLCASITEEESGAYITRCALAIHDEQHTHTYATKPQTPYMLYRNEVLPRSAPVDGGDITTMNDSGYLEAELHPYSLHTFSQVSDDSLMTPTPVSLDSEQLGKLIPQVSSKRSSLSDPAMHDLASDLSSRESYIQGDLDNDEVDDDVLSVEINVTSGDDIEGDVASTDTLIGSLLHSYSDDQSTTDTTIHSNSPRDMGNNSRCSNSKDSWTDSSDLWRDIDDLSSNYSPSPKHLLTHLQMEECEYVATSHGSPLSQTRSNHSRTSSITSTDIELEATSVDIYPRDDIEKMEIELIEIKQELCEVEERLTDLMSVDTTKLYFNVDNMKKLTEVVLNSDDIELTPNEIAKAFHILRKYRYTFTTPEKKQQTTFAHKETELSEFTEEQKVVDRSLPYLDLADNIGARKSFMKTMSVSPSRTDTSLRLADIPNPVIKEWNLKDYCSSQSILQEAYELLTEEFGFTSLCLLKLDESALQAAAFISMMIHDKSMHVRSIDSEQLIQKLEVMYSTDHTYIAGWKFKHLDMACSSNVLNTMKLCIKTLLSQAKRLANIENIEERKTELFNLFNITPSMRGLLIEGIQLLTFITVCDLFKGYFLNEGVPIFTWLLFARDCSDNPRTFFNNYNQTTKESYMPGQADIDLLGYAFGVKLQTFRPTKAGRSDFMVMSQSDALTYPFEESLVPLAIHSATTYAILY